MADFRFLSILGGGAQGIVLRATHRRLEATAATSVGVLLFPGESATSAEHEAAATLEFSERNTGSDSQIDVQLARHPLYVAIKRVDIDGAAEPPWSPASSSTSPLPANNRSDYNGSPQSALSSGRSTPTRLDSDSGWFHARKLRTLASESSAETSLLARYTDEAAVAVPIADAAAMPAAIQLEVDLLLRLRHPNIVRLFGSYVSAGHLYLVTELVVGGDLAKAISTL
ncbi:MAG: protein kinase, partial [Myxococcales bacterium]|nr:protein kinase [Myxococcales bacterium]